MEAEAHTHFSSVEHFPPALVLSLEQIPLLRVAWQVELPAAESKLENSSVSR